MATGSNHLAERLAQRVGGVGGLGAADVPSPTPRPASGAIPMPPPVRPDDPSSSTLGGSEGHQGFDDEQPSRVSEADAGVIGRAVGSSSHSAGGASMAAGSRAASALLSGDFAVTAGPGVNLDMVLPTPITLDLVALERAGMVVGRKSRTRISEEFRVTVGQILRSVRGSYTPGRGAGNLVMVTSARPGEGKSFSSLNFAGSIAQHTQREVLLVDVDAKQNALSDQLGIGDRPGLIDLAVNQAMRIEDTVVRTVIPNLSVLPVGIRRVDSPEGGAEGTVARPITSLIERLGRRYANHIVILDAPPCLSTSDPSTLAPFVGQIVMVVEAERTQRSEVLAALDLIKACPTITLMLNKIRVTTSYTFGAYHYFGSYS